jgi:hypothetical protein
VEDSGEGVAAARLSARILGSGAYVLGLLLSAPAARAEPLDRLIPGLFGGTLSTSITPQVSDRTPDTQQVLVAQRFRGLSSALAVARSQAPVPSATGALRFEWDDDLEVYVRSVESLGPLIAERAQTLGRRTITLSMSYTRVDFDTLDGDRLDRLQTVQDALSPGFRMGLPAGDQMRAADNKLVTQLDLNFGFDLFFFTAAYGVTDTIDVSLALSVNQARMHATANAFITDPNGDQGAFFTVNQKGAVIGGSGPICGSDFRCATDSFDDSAFGTGDLFLRGKWHFYDTEYVDFAAAAILTLPTGNADDFLGFHAPTFTPWLILSKTFDRVSPHINLGYSFRSSADVSQAQWIAGADLRAFDWLTLAADFLGFHDDNSNGINDNVFQSAVGFKVNPIGNWIIGTSFQFPLNSDGLRADVIYTGQVEYTLY